MPLRPLSLALNVLVLAAALAIVAGAAGAAFDLASLPSGRREVLLPLAATSFTRAWITALAALTVWLVVFALGARVRLLLSRGRVHLREVVQPVELVVEPEDHMGKVLAEGREGAR